MPEQSGRTNDPRQPAGGTPPSAGTGRRSAFSLGRRASGLGSLRRASAGPYPGTSARFSAPRKARPETEQETEDREDRQPQAESSPEHSEATGLSGDGPAAADLAPVIKPDIKPDVKPDRAPDLARQAFEDEAARMATLTPKERGICRLVASGLSDRRVGEILAVTPSQVREILQGVGAKLGASNRLELIILCYRHELR